MECQEAEAQPVPSIEYLLVKALEKALYLPCPQPLPAISSPTP